MVVLLADPKDARDPVNVAGFDIAVLIGRVQRFQLHPHRPAAHQFLGHDFARCGFDNHAVLRADV